MEQETEREDLISVIIDNTEGDAYLDLCQEAIRASAVGLDVEIFVGIDPATIKGTKLVLRADCIIGEDLIRSLHYHLMEHPAVSVVGVKLINTSGEFVRSSKENKPTVWDNFYMRMGFTSRFPNVNRFNKRYKTAKSESKEQRVDVLASDLKMYPSDTDLLEANYHYVPLRALSIRHQAKKLKTHRRMQVIAYEKSMSEIRPVCAKKLPSLQFINLWDLDSNRVLDAISRKNQMKQFTDITFCYPDVRFEQMFLFMEQHPSKLIHYYIYNKNSGTLIAL